MGRGQLVFKKKNKTKHTVDRGGGHGDGKPTKHHDGPVSTGSERTTTTASASLSTAEPSKTTLTDGAAATAPPQIISGTGKITSSGTVVTGHGTLFEKELSAGDAILVGVGTPQQEMRVVTMRLSNMPLNLSSAFTYVLKTPTEFSYIRKPRDAQKEARAAAKQQQLEQRHEKEHTLGTYAAAVAGEVVYREKTEHGSYRIKRDKLSTSGGVSRSELLDLRAKRASDKYC